MTKTVGDHRYHESGLDNVVLRGVPLYTCEACGAKRVTIIAMAQLHRLLAHLIATKPARLVPAEVGFLRDHLELSNREFALLMGVTEAQASRWTSSEPIGVPAERFLRVLATLGPDVLASRRGGAETSTVLDVPKLVESLQTMLEELPSKDEPAKEIPVRVRRAASEWRPELPS